jgi:hypothetical protein
VRCVGGISAGRQESASPGVGCGAGWPAPARAARRREAASRRTRKVVKELRPVLPQRRPGLQQALPHVALAQHVALGHVGAAARRRDGGGVERRPRKHEEVYPLAVHGLDVSTTTCSITTQGAELNCGLTA